MGLFSDIYNTVAKFFRPHDENAVDPSKAVATNRLRLVLMQDRTNLTPKVLEQMRSELVDLLSKYLEMDKELLELNFEQEGDQVALMLSIPVIRAKDEAEIEMAVMAEKDSENDSDEEDDEDLEEESDSEEMSSEEENQESIEGEEKPKRKRSKKVTPPEEMNDNQEEHHEESSIEFENNEA